MERGEEGFRHDIDEDKTERMKGSGEYDWDIDDYCGAMQPSPLTELISRPAAMIARSSFIKHLEDQIRAELIRAGCCQVPNEAIWLYDEIRKEALKPSGSPTEPVYGTYDSMISNEAEEKILGRLKIYKRGFSALILHFEALRPILRDIKRNYDAVLNLRDRQVAEGNIVKRKIHHLELSLDEKMATVRFEGFRQLSELEKQCFLLMRHVDKQDMAMNIMTDILNKLEASLSEEFDLRRDSEDQRKLLISEINELRRKMGLGPRPTIESLTLAVEDEEEETSIEAESTDEFIDTEDPILLRRALEICRNDLTTAQQRLTVLEADYSDVMPRSEHEGLKVAMKSLEEDHSRSMKTYEELKFQATGFKEQIETLMAERTNLSDVVSDLRKKATPRPSWEKLGDHINGGMTRWKAMYEGKSSADIVPRLVQELTGKNILGPPEYFPALGTGAHVPKYLSYEGSIRRRHFSRRDVLLVLQDIWQSRAEGLDTLRRYNEARDEEAAGDYSDELEDAPKEMPIIPPFLEFVTDYLESRFPIPSMRMEWTYNIVESCRKLGSIEPKLTQFLDILEERADEANYHLLRSQVAKLRNAVIKKSEITGQPVGSIQFSFFGDVIAETFPEKNKEEVERLMKAASKQSGIFSGHSIVRYISFFAMTDEGLTGVFVEEFAKQFDEDRHHYAQEVLTALLPKVGLTYPAAEKDGDPGSEKEVSMSQVYSAFVFVDPTIPDTKLGAALSWVFMGHSTLPGAKPAGAKLVEFLRTRLRISEANASNETGGGADEEDEDDGFERAIGDFLSEKELEELNEMGVKTKRKWFHLRKFTNLRNVVRRLNGGAILRHGPQVVVEAKSPKSEEGEGEITANDQVSGATTERKTSNPPVTETDEAADSEIAKPSSASGKKEKKKKKGK